MMSTSTVNVLERVRFWHKKVHLLANNSFAFLTRRAAIGREVYILMPKNRTPRNFDGITSSVYYWKKNKNTILRVYLLNQYEKLRCQKV